jgi:hypothetical protein
MLPHAAEMIYMCKLLLFSRQAREIALALSIDGARVGLRKYDVVLVPKFTKVLFFHQATVMDAQPKKVVVGGDVHACTHSKRRPHNG